MPKSKKKTPVDVTPTLENVNQHQVRRNPQYVDGILTACSIINDYASSVNLPYLPGDYVLAKMNLIEMKRMRRNQHYDKRHA